MNQTNKNVRSFTILRLALTLSFLVALPVSLAQAARTQSPPNAPTPEPSISPEPGSSGAPRLTAEQGVALVEAYKKALAVYKRAKDSNQAVRLLENAGIKSALAIQPEGLSDETYVELLNDYGFFLSETTDRFGEAIPVLERVIQLRPDRAVAHLNLGDVFVKEIDKNADTGAKQEMRELALEQYEAYAKLLQNKKLETLPKRVRDYLNRAHAVKMSGRQYKSVMSKDGEVCAHMLALYNADLERYREIRHDAHTEFTAIHWAPMTNLGGELHQMADALQIAKFDIDNDGQDEFVVKEHSSLRGREYEYLTIFQATADAPILRPNIGIKELDQNEGQIGNFSGPYFLKGMKVGDKEPYVGGLLAIMPFIYKGRTLISMKDLWAEYEAKAYELNAISENWLVIAKYNRAKGLDDVCYFQMLTPLPKKGAANDKER